MTKKLNSLQELREIKEDGPSAQERFNKLVKGNIGRVSSGNFNSKLNYINSITIVTPQSEEGEPSQLNITVFHGGNADEKKETLTLTNEGELIGSVPDIKLSEKKDRKFTKEILLEELMDIIEAANPKFFTSVDDNILPPGDEPLVEGEGGNGEVGSESTEQKTEKITDPRRLNIVTGMDKALFGFVGANSGFNGYYGVVFPHCLVLENPKIGNAAYIVKFEDEIEVDPDKLEEDPPERFPDEDRRGEVLEERWKPYAELTKKEMQNLANATRVIHPPHNREDYTGFVRSAIENAAESAGVNTQEVTENANVSGDGAPGPDL